MRLQYVSDIHLEFYDPSTMPPFSTFVKPDKNTPYLALCGDIGIPDLDSYKDFLTWCSKNWSTVFLIAGNHEFYNMKCKIKTTMDQKKDIIKRICSQLPNVYFLDCDSVWLESEKVRVLGCTLWSEIDDKIINRARTTTNEPKQVLVDPNEYAQPEILREIHRIERDWLYEEIQKATAIGEKCLVLTHYLPSYQLIAEKYKGDWMNSCFASHCDDLIHRPVAAWICGHSHVGKKIGINNILVALNPYGYPDENMEVRTPTSVIYI